MFFTLRKSLLLLFCCAFFQTFSQQSLSEILVSTTKLPVKESQLSKSMTIISDSVINAHSSWSVSELLQRQTGISIVGASQTLGSIQSLYMRGGNSGHTLLLLDGIPLYDPSSTESNFDLNQIDLQNIERIEILKGGQSTLYGSDALAGVINFITKKNGSKVITPYGKFTYGSFNTTLANVRVDGMLAEIGYNIGINKTKSEGISSAISQDDLEENDAFDRLNFDASLSKNIGAFNLKAYYRLSDYRTDIDGGAFVDDSDYAQKSLNSQLGANISLVKEKWSLHLLTNLSKIERSYEDDSLFVPSSAFAKYSLATFGSKSNFTELYGNFYLPNNSVLLLGADFRTQSISQTYFSVSSFGPFEDIPLLNEDTKTNNVSFYSDLQLLINERVGLDIGGRMNIHSIYKNNLTYSINPFYKPNDFWMFYGVLATSFKNPSLYQLYSPYGNLELTPEHSRNIEAGVKFNKGFKAEIVWFNRKHTDKIGFVNSSMPPYGFYDNIDEQYANGIEVSGRQSFKSIGLSGNYTFLDGYNLSEGIKSDLIRRPKHSINLGFNYSLNNKWNLNLNYQYISKRKDTYYDSAIFSTVDLDLESYSLFDLDVNYKLTNRIKVYIAGYNLLNKQYTEISGYNSKPFNFRLGVAYN